MEEPSLLDYLKGRLFPHKYPPVELPEEWFGETEAEQAPPEPAIPPLREPAAPAPRPALPWRMLMALALALLAQALLGMGEGPTRFLGAVFLLATVAALLWAERKGEAPWAPSLPDAQSPDPATVDLYSLGGGLVLLALAFLTSGNLKFNLVNLTFLGLGLWLTARAFWLPGEQRQPWWPRLRRAWERVRQGLTIRGEGLAAIIAVGVILFFRFYRLAEVPPEMNSDHAEKILDILRVLNGQTLIFFPSNGGREALIFYLNAALHRWLGLPLGFTLLKVTSVLIGLAALPFLYALGLELGSRRLAWGATLLAGIAYWPNVVSRFGLRLPFYFLFTAAVCYFLVRGLRSGRRNFLVLAGLTLGVGFYGYTADRILPLLALFGLGLYGLHQRSPQRGRLVAFGLVVIVVLSVAALLPMLRFALEQPNAFFYRTLSRLGEVERPLEAPPWTIFLGNVWRALTMFSADAGEIWPVSVPHRPALGVVSGALFYLGAVALVVRYRKERHWLDLFLLLSIPILQLPSTLSLAFPAENPNLYRTGGAFVPVFLMCGLALDGLMRQVEHAWKGANGQRLAWGMALLLFALAALQEYSLTFRLYAQQYRAAAWNSTEMGEVARSFITTMGSVETVWVVGYPHWVDTRLVALNAGYPGYDFQIFPGELENTLRYAAAKLFILNPQDQETVVTLRQLYPHGWLMRRSSRTPGKDFLLYLVPPSSPAAQPFPE